MSRFRILDGSAPGKLRQPYTEYRRAGDHRSLGSTILSEAMALRNGLVLPRYGWYNPSINCSVDGFAKFINGESNIMIGPGVSNYLAVHNFSTPVGPNLTGFSKAVSEDGLHRIRLAGDPASAGNYRVLLSHDGGVTESQLFGAIGVKSSLTISDDGQKIFISRGPTYASQRSSNGGATFSTGTPYSASSGFSNQSIAASPDGVHIIISDVGSSDPIVVSHDSGATFTSVYAVSGFRGVAISSDGNTLYALRGTGGGATAIVRSLNGGTTWSTLQSFTSGQAARGLACSADGQRVVVATTNEVRLSTDAGVSFSVQNTNPNGDVNMICFMSRNGQSYGASNVQTSLYTL